MFALITDHKPTIFDPRTGMETASMQRWAPTQIEYCKTNQHGNADGLSQLTLKRDKDIPCDISSCYNLDQMTAIPLTHVQLNERRVTKQYCPEYTLNGWHTEAISEELRLC